MGFAGVEGGDSCILMSPSETHKNFDLCDAAEVTSLQYFLHHATHLLSLISRTETVRDLLSNLRSSPEEAFRQKQLIAMSMCCFSCGGNNGSCSAIVTVSSV